MVRQYRRVPGQRCIGRSHIQQESDHGRLTPARRRLALLAALGMTACVAGAAPAPGAPAPSKPASGAAAPAAAPTPARAAPKAPTSPSVATAAAAGEVKMNVMPSGAAPKDRRIQPTAGEARQP